MATSIMLIQNDKIWLCEFLGAMELIVNASRGLGSLPPLRKMKSVFFFRIGSDGDSLGA